MQAVPPVVGLGRRVVMLCMYACVRACVREKMKGKERKGRGGKGSCNPSFCWGGDGKNMGWDREEMNACMDEDRT